MDILVAEELPPHAHLVSNKMVFDNRMEGQLLPQTSNLRTPHSTETLQKPRAGLEDRHEERHIPCDFAMHILHLTLYKYSLALIICQP